MATTTADFYSKNWLKLNEILIVEMAKGLKNKKMAMVSHFKVLKENVFYGILLKNLKANFSS